MTFKLSSVVALLRRCAVCLLVIMLAACGGWETHASSQSVRAVNGKGIVGKVLADSAAKAHENEIETWCDGRVVQDDRNAEFHAEKNNTAGRVESNVEHKVEAAHKCL